MPLPISQIVDVTISVSPTAPARAGFGTLLLLTAELGVISSAERVREYADITGVAEDWGPSTEVYKAATAYFSQSPKPTSFMVGMRFDTAQAASLRGSAVDSDLLTTLQGITNGAFTVSMTGQSEEISGLNFSAATSLADCATIVETALQAVASGDFTASTTEYSAGAFTVATGTTGSGVTIGYASAPTGGTDVSELLGLAQGGSIVSDGLDAETVVESLNAIEEADDSWYGFMFTKEVRENVSISGEFAVTTAASWAEARVKVFFNTSNDTNCLVAAATSDIMYSLAAASYSRTISTFSSYPTQYPSASVAGRAFTTQFTAGSPAMTLKFKQMPGITNESLSVSQKSALDGKFGNALVKYGDSIMYAEGYVASGRFFDEVHGLDWLQNAIQTNVFAYLYQKTSKVPYTDVGIQALRQQVINALEEGVEAGLLAPGNDSEDNFLSTGYEVLATPAASVSSSDKEARQYNGLSFTAIGAGAIHGVVISGVFER